MYYRAENTIIVLFDLSRDSMYSATSQEDTYFG